jgi:RNA polymerase primary sigma factor
MRDNTTTPTTAQNSTTTHSMQCYFEEMSRFQLLSREEEIELGTRIQENGDPEAREKMIQANLRLVVKIANDYSMFGLPVEDLVSEGNIGLMKAVDRFDPSYGVKFSTYASWWIKQGIKAALGNQSRTIRLPLHLIQKLRELDKAELELSLELGRDPNSDELSQREEGLTGKRVAYLRRVSQPVASLDDHTSEDGADHYHMATLIPDDSAPDPRAAAITNERHATLSEMFSILNEREQEVIASRFGLGDREAMTLEQVGVTFGVTRERIRQIQKAALGKLNSAMKLRERRVDKKRTHRRNISQFPQLLETLSA